MLNINIKEKHKMSPLNSSSNSERNRTLAEKDARLEAFLRWNGWYELLKEKREQRHLNGEYTDEEL